MAEPGYQSIIYEKKPPIAYITLNRPEKYNALSSGSPGTILDELDTAITDLRGDNGIEVFVVKANGPHFSGGYDISPRGESRGEKLGEPQDAWLLDENQLERCRFWQRLFWDNPKPSIAQVHGYCLAGACHMTSNVDIIICSDDALFGHPAVRFGAVDPQQFWPYYLGIRKAKELLMTGNFMSAAEALKIGWVNKVVPIEKLEEEVNKLAMSIAVMPPKTASYNKFAVNRCVEAMGLQQFIYTASSLDAEMYSSHLPRQLWDFRRNVETLGLKAALQIRDEPFAARDKEIAEENRREAKQFRASYEERMKL